MEIDGTDDRKYSWDMRFLIPRILCRFLLSREVAGKMADLHVYFISALVLSCCLQILAGYVRLTLP